MRCHVRGEVQIADTCPATALLRQADSAFNGGNLAAALQQYDEALILGPANLDAHLRRAELFISLGDVPRARQALAAAQTLGPGHWKTTWYTARLLDAQRQWAAAADHYQRVIDDLPGETEPIRALAANRVRAGDHMEAVTLYSFVLRAEPSDTDAIMGLAAALINLQRWDEAVTVLNNVPEGSSRYLSAQLQLCDILVHRVLPLVAANVVRAAAILDRLGDHHDDPRYLLTRGDIYYAAQQLARSHALPADAGLPAVSKPTARNLGRIAEASYQQYLERKPDDPAREEVVRRRFKVAPWRLW